MSVFKTVINSFFPNTCIACGDIIEDGEYFCDYCYGMLHKIDFTKNCMRCGCEKKFCECKYRVFYYDGMAAPYYNTTSSQKAMYKYKFRKQERNAKFFARQMSITVKNVYRDVEFDGVTYVPLNIKRRLKRGFNQSKIFAKEIADILEIRLLDNLLYRNGKRINQHDLKNPKERFKNVQGLYGCKYKVKGKTILLVDDIKTTGATLNECAKQLILSGADKVYCITGLITERKKKNGN